MFRLDVFYVKCRYTRLGETISLRDGTKLSKLVCDITVRGTPNLAGVYIVAEVKLVVT